MAELRSRSLGTSARLSPGRGSGPRRLTAREAAMVRRDRWRPPAHPLEYDESGFPISQRPLSFAARLRRVVTG